MTAASDIYSLGVLLFELLAGMLALSRHRRFGGVVRACHFPRASAASQCSRLRN